MTNYNERLHLVTCGKDEEWIVVSEDGTVLVGHFEGTRDEAENYIRKEKGEEVDLYLAKLAEAIEGTDDPEVINKYATHDYFWIRCEVAEQGFELEKILQDEDPYVRSAARKKLAKDEVRNAMEEYYTPLVEGGHRSQDELDEMLNKVDTLTGVFSPDNDPSSIHAAFADGTTELIATGAEWDYEKMMHEGATIGQKRFAYVSEDGSESEGYGMFFPATTMCNDINL